MQQAVAANGAKIALDAHAQHFLPFGPVMAGHKMQGIFPRQVAVIERAAGTSSIASA
jgi:hypothetical protein